MSQKIIGIDLGGTSIKFAILTTAGEIQEKWSIKTNILDEGSHIVDDMIESIQHRLDLLGLVAADFQGIGMGSPGVVDREKGTVIGAYNLNWKTLQPIKEKMEKALGIPFFIDNDANVAALGERWVGAGANNPDVVFVTLGTGVGGGVIADGNLIHGVGGAGGNAVNRMVQDGVKGVEFYIANTDLQAMDISPVANKLYPSFTNSSTISIPVSIAFTAFS